MIKVNYKDLFSFFTAKSAKFSLSVLEKLWEKPCNSTPSGLVGPESITSPKPRISYGANQGSAPSGLVR